MHILIAPNAFKHSLTAHEAALAIQKGLAASRLTCTTHTFPIADGGDGTGELIIQCKKGLHEQVEVKDPLGRTCNARIGFTDHHTAIIEMADASGIRLLDTNELDPLTATSYGTGQLIRYALDKKVNKILLAMGGSATVDGGMGICNALGVHYLDQHNKKIIVPADLDKLQSIDLTEMDIRINDVELIILCDVDNPLTGPAGAAAVFGPQKGADNDGVILLDKGLDRLAEIVALQTGRDMRKMKYGGTAGGAAAGLSALLGATLEKGIDHFLELTGFDVALSKADLIITGEGSIDEQTLQGKGPFGVASRAKNQGKAVIGIAGKIPLRYSEEVHSYFDVLLALGHEPASLPAAIKQTSANLERVCRELGNLLHMGQSKL